MNRPKKDFHLSHLAMFVMSIALILAAHEYNPFAAIISCSLTLAPLTAFTLTRNRSAIIAGVASSIFWTTAAVVPVLGVLFAISIDEFSKLHSFLLTFVAMLIAVAAGYVGAKIDLH